MSSPPNSPLFPSSPGIPESPLPNGNTPPISSLSQHEHLKDYAPEAMYNYTQVGLSNKGTHPLIHIIDTMSDDNYYSGFATEGTEWVRKKVAIVRDNLLVRYYIANFLPLGTFRGADFQKARLKAAQAFVEKYFRSDILGSKVEEEAATLREVCTRQLKRAIDGKEGFCLKLDNGEKIEIPPVTAKNNYRAAIYYVHWVLLKLLQCLAGGCTDCKVFHGYLQEDHITPWERALCECAGLLSFSRVDVMFFKTLFFSETVCDPCHKERTMARKDQRRREAVVPGLEEAKCVMCEERKQREREREEEMKRKEEERKQREREREEERKREEKRKIEEEKMIKEARTCVVRHMWCSISTCDAAIEVKFVLPKTSTAKSAEDKEAIVAKYIVTCGLPACEKTALENGLDLARNMKFSRSKFGRNAHGVRGATTKGGATAKERQAQNWFEQWKKRRNELEVTVTRAIDKHNNALAFARQKGKKKRKGFV